MKTLCIYHNIDLDGWMSAAIVKHWAEKTNQGEIDFLGYNYGDPIPVWAGYDKIVMCDISFPVVVMDQIASTVDNIQKDFIWIDHHISAIKECSFEINDEKYMAGYGGIRDTNFAACELTWNFFFPNEEMPEIVRLLGRYDCFGHKGTDEEKLVLEFQYGARGVIKNYKDAYEYLIYDSIDVILIEGKGIYRYLCAEAQQVYKIGFKLTLFGRKFICINRERFNPVNFGIDYHSDGYEGAACFHFDGNKWTFSLYNDNGKVDVSEIAKEFGGGGHKGAAGFRIDNLSTIL